MIPTAISDVSRNLVPFGLIIVLLLFARLAIKSKSIRTVQSELSIFVIIWVIAELLRALLVLRVIQASPALQLVGLQIHTASMLAFGFFIIFRFYRYSRSEG